MVKTPFVALDPLIQSPYYLFVTFLVAISKKGLSMTKIVIVGGVAGGATAAARLRRLDELAEIIIFERGEFISFANCGLPYYVGRVITNRDALLLQTPESFHQRFNVDVRVFSEVLSVDRQAQTVEVLNRQTGERYHESYDKLVLSPGAAPTRPQIEGLNSKRVFALHNMADLDAITAFIRSNKPKSAVVAGGGFIGLETAENLRGLGLKVSIAQSPAQVLSPLDFDMACGVHDHLRQHGISLYLNNRLLGITEQGSKLKVRLQTAELEADMLVLAIGVVPESRLALEAGLDVNERGGIIVDATMRTSDPNIYAVGDAVEVTDFVSSQPAIIPLAGPANKQGRIAADNICGIPSTYSGTQGSLVIKVFDLTVAATGINEKTAQRLELDYDKVVLWLPGHAGYYPGAKPMSLKVIFEKGSGRILGAQIVGFNGVDKRCDVLAVAIRAGMTAHDLTQLELCYAPPYSSAKDPVNMAGYAIENLLSGKVKQIHWNDVDSLPRDRSVFLLDVRSTGEVARGPVTGFFNIPVDSLRNRLRELDKSKPVYVLCHSGLRSYVACRILTQHGFDAYSICGGYRLYNTVKSNL